MKLCLSLLLYITTISTIFATRNAERPEWAIDSTEVKNLNLEINSTLFFQDNEFDTPMMRGYTLPGFQFRPSISYRPNENVNVDLGVYLFLSLIHI